MLTSKEIKQKNFSKNSLGGYKNEEIEEFINKVSKDYESLEVQNEELFEKIEVLADKITEYRNNEAILGEAILSAQRTADTVKREADSYADEKKSNADAQAESILREAKEKAFKMVNEANNKYREVLAVGEEKIREQLAQYTYLAKQMDDFKSNLKSICESQIELIDSQKVDDSKIKEYIKEYPLKTEQ